MAHDSATEVSPRYCPRCFEVEAGEGWLCRICGERLILQGFCAICEDCWSIPAGKLCPKHDVELEIPSPRKAANDESEDALSWFTVATYPDALKAEAPRIRLEAEGIPTFLEGARMGSHSMYQVATGGVKLQVPEALASDARVLLAQSWTPAIVDDDLDDAWDDLAPEPGAFRRRVMKGVIVFLLIAPVVMTILSFCFGR